MNSANKVIFNTGVLYSKMLITIVITLYSTRIALNALGSSSYGIFCLVAGVISMLSFLNTAMTISTQRYLSYYMGHEGILKLNKIFSTSVILHLIIGIFIVIIFEIVGFFLFDGILNIPKDSLYQAKYIYHFMVISSFFTIISVPYDAIINSHENMLFISILSIIESVGKLLIAFYILSLDSNRLIVYGGLLTALTIILIIVKRKFSLKKYIECRGVFKVKREKKMLKDMFSFASWNLYGSICGLARNQGIAVVLNYYFGTVVNAAYGIANQVNGQLSYFSASILLAFNPQIMKSEGAGDRERMLKLSALASKFSFYLLSFFSIPLIVEMNYVLHIWLGEVPEYAVIFCQLILLLTITNQLSVGLQSAAQAVGKIKLYQFAIGTINLFSPILGFFALKYGVLNASVVIIITIVIEFIAGSWRIFFLKSLAGLSIKKYLLNVILPCISIFIIVITASFIIHNILNISSFFNLVITCLSSSILISILVYTFGISKSEKQKLFSMLESLLSKFRKKNFNEI